MLSLAPQKCVRGIFFCFFISRSDSPLGSATAEQLHHSSSPLLLVVSVVFFVNIISLFFLLSPSALPRDDSFLPQRFPVALPVSVCTLPRQLPFFSFHSSPLQLVRWWAKRTLFFSSSLFLFEKSYLALFLLRLL